MAASLLGRREPADPNSAAATAGDDDIEAYRGLAEVAFDFLASPLSVFRKATGNPAEPNFATSSNLEISRLSLHYSSANLSEEESSSLINILDRKKYNDKLAATRSADD